MNPTKKASFYGFTNGLEVKALPIVTKCITLCYSLMSAQSAVREKNCVAPKMAPNKSRKYITAFPMTVGIGSSIPHNPELD